MRKGLKNAVEREVHERLARVWDRAFVAMQYIRYFEAGHADTSEAEAYKGRVRLREALTCLYLLGEDVEPVHCAVAERDWETVMPLLHERRAPYFGGR